MRKIFKLFVLFIENSKIRFARAMIYRVNYIMDSFISLTFAFIGPLLQYLIFSQTRGFPGWNLDQIILFQGILLLHLGLRNTCFGSLHFYMMDLVRRGEFDRLLLKPYPAIGVILASGFNPRNFGSVFAGLTIIIYSIIKLNLILTFSSIIMFILLLFFGLFLYMSIEIIYSSAVIVLVHLGRLYDIIGQLTNFGHYPLEIFSRSLQVFFMTAVPMAIWVNFPARVLLGRGNINIVYSIIFSIVFFFLSLGLWRICLKRYTSAGG
ncbi:MAG: ABC-2 family transporter protein [Spirochaetales bacterium]|nr:ABC-2 family transporter protein [Spirochaetales bacterium]